MKGAIRAFIGIILTPEMKNELSQVQSELKEAGADVKWVKPASIHLTLKFLGDISTQKVADVKKVLDLASSRHKAFEMTLFKIGCFPKMDHPRVIWVGIDRGCSQAESLAKTIDDELGSIGFQIEARPYTAHLTLGRVRSPKSREGLVSKIKTLDFSPCATSHSDKLTLFQSTLTPQGSIYTPLYEAKLS
ncbi:MAG: RNA 2',3'-cyclic phosphodiesterase [Candidatus Omnitrophota bacterium]